MATSMLDHPARMLLATGERSWFTPLQRAAPALHICNVWLKPQARPAQ